MMFARRLRDGVRDGSITCTVRIWQSPRVKPGGRYPIGGGHVVVDSIREITLDDLTDALARRSGFDDVGDLLDTARHGAGTDVYLIEFHFVAENA
ncbi:MAG: ASCH domain-containing protein [Proteobacteria bacterium]|nr:ASCH domain-containing protein [Pseudomonadota bacterium]